MQLTGYQEAAMQQLGGLTGGSGAGAGAGGGAAAAARLPAAERRQIEAAIEAAFTQGTGGRRAVGRAAELCEVPCRLGSCLALPTRSLCSRPPTPSPSSPPSPSPSPSTDEAFERLLEVTGAAGADDMDAGAPGVNVQHSGAYYFQVGGEVTGPQTVLP